MIALAPPVTGAVYGFSFVFPPKTHGEPHPGLIIGVRDLGGGKSEVIALPISHKEPRLHEPHLVVPMQERLRIGLDLGHQSVFYGQYGKFTLPVQVRKLMQLDKYFVGQASPGFLQEVLERFLEHRKSR